MQTDAVMRVGALVLRNLVALIRVEEGRIKSTRGGPGGLDAVNGEEKGKEEEEESLEKESGEGRASCPGEG